MPRGSLLATMWNSLTSRTTPNLKGGLMAKKKAKKSSKKK